MSLFSKRFTGLRKGARLIYRQYIKSKRGINKIKHLTYSRKFLTKVINVRSDISFQVVRSKSIHWNKNDWIFGWSAYTRQWINTWNYKRRLNLSVNLKRVEHFATCKQSDSSSQLLITSQPIGTLEVVIGLASISELMSHWPASKISVACVQTMPPSPQEKSKGVCTQVIPLGRSGGGAAIGPRRACFQANMPIDLSK